ncbi:MAG: LamG domain-containing protein [Planctomycetota bacterium]|nr:LamG domain-containing protein [Planctomycetota bacterium]
MADAPADYKAVFGEEERTVLAAGGGASVKFAAKLLDAAKGVGKQPDFQALLCEKAYEFGMKEPTGYSVAIDAMKLLGEAAPDKKALAQKRILEASELRFTRSPRADRKRLGEELIDLWLAAGDEQAAAGALTNALASYNKAVEVAKGAAPARAGEVSDKIKQTTAAIELEAKLANLRKRLKDSPKSVPTRTSLILAYLGEADDPAEAAKLLSDDLDAKFRTYLPLAARPVGELAESACWELANWYPELAEKVSSPAGKGVLLGRAKACGERFLELHADHDVARLKGTSLLAKIDKELAQVDPLSRRAAANLVLHLAFDKDEGAKVSDASGKGNHGAVVGAQYAAKGKKGGGYSLSGSSQHITVPNSATLEIREALTVAVWVNLASFAPGGYGNEWGIIVNKGDDLWMNPAFCLGYAKSGPPLFHVGNATDPQRGGGKTVVAAAKLVPGQWVHLAGTYDGAAVKLYVNGRLEGAEKYAGPLRSDKAPVHLGGGKLFGVDWGNHFTVHGTIDEVMIFRCALSAAEIRQIYQPGRTP